MGLEGSLPCSQEPATCPCPDPDASGPDLPTLFSRVGSTQVRNNEKLIFHKHTVEFRNVLLP